jgi:hypothetical protein
LPEQLQQYSEQLQQASAAWHSEQQQAASAEAGADADGDAIADLLGLGDGFGFGSADSNMAAAAAIEGEPLLDVLMTDADLEAAEDAAAQFAPSLAAFSQQQQQQQMASGQADAYDSLWGVREDESDGGWQMPVAARSSALWGSAAGDDSASNDYEPWEQLDRGSDDDTAEDADAFELLFGSHAGSTEVVETTAAGGDSAAVDIDGLAFSPAAGGGVADSVAISLEVEQQDSTGVAAAFDAAGVLVLDTAAGVAMDDIHMAAAPESTAAVAAAAPSSEAEQQAATDSFDDFLASLSLQQKSGLHTAGASRQQQLAAAAAMPEGLKHTMQQIVDLLHVLVAAQGSSKDSTAAAAASDTGKCPNAPPALWFCCRMTGGVDVVSMQMTITCNVVVKAHHTTVVALLGACLRLGCLFKISIVTTTSLVLCCVVHSKPTTASIRSLLTVFCNGSGTCNGVGTTNVQILFFVACPLPLPAPHLTSCSCLPDAAQDPVTLAAPLQLITARIRPTVHLQGRPSHTRC